MSPVAPNIVQSFSPSGGRKVESMSAVRHCFHLTVFSEYVYLTQMHSRVFGAHLKVSHVCQTRNRDRKYERCMPP
jgi:hypothetical protein